MLHDSILYNEDIKSSLSIKIQTSDMLIDWRFKNNGFEYIFGPLFNLFI